jgi:hypothetical protein
VAVANGVVYFHTSWQFSFLYALDATNGNFLTNPAGSPDGGI